MKEILAKILKNLGNPVWQGICGLVAIITLIIPLLYGLKQAAESPRDIVIGIGERYSLISLIDKSAPVLTYSVDGLTGKSLIVCKFSITSVNSNPVLGSDVVEPLSVSCNEGYRIAAIYPAQNSLRSQWYKVSDQQQNFAPSLINPNDKFSIVVLVTEQPGVDVPPGETSKWESELKFKWSFRAVGVAPLKARSEAFPVQDGEWFLAGSLGFGEASPGFLYHGYGYTFFLVLLVSLLVGSVFLFSGLRLGFWMPIYVSFHIVISILTAEIVATYSAGVIGGILPMCYVTIALYIASSAYLVWLQLKRVKANGVGP